MHPWGRSVTAHVSVPCNLQAETMEIAKHRHVWMFKGALHKSFQYLLLILQLQVKERLR